jgi:hypothetical protein
MTAPQHQKYIRDWSTCAKANGWKMVKGRLVLDEAKLNEHGRKVLAAATAIAAAQHRAPVLEDLRHGIHVVALGRDKSSKVMKNAECDAVFALLKLLVNDCDLGADMKFAKPDRGERERLLIYISRLKIPEAIILNVCRKSFAPVFRDPWFEKLPLVNLRSLAGILREIKARKNHPLIAPMAAKAEPELALAGAEAKHVFPK